MEAKIVLGVILIESLLVGGLFLLYPRIARKGLLFGVYVGEAKWSGAEARRITRIYRGMAGLAISLSLALGLLSLALAKPHPVFVLGPIFLLLAGCLGAYLRAYFMARALAPAGPPPPGVAPLLVHEPSSPLLPLVTLAFGLAAGLSVLAYAWSRYPALPERVPIHFGLTGEPDAWRVKSVGTVMVLPFLTLVMGVALSGLAWLMTRAKRALRQSDRGVSLAAQMAFRRVMIRFLCGAALLTTAMLALMSVSTVRVGLGQAGALHPAGMVLTGALLLYALGGSIYLAVRYGQGGSRLERSAGDAPLTDGLADNRYWVLGTFYVNRDDPSILVEHRFGLGYTINFGNWKAVALLAGFLALILAVPLLTALFGP